MATFTLTIELGNDAMQTGYDVAGVLRDVAERVQLFYRDTVMQDDYSGLQRDINGATVCHFEVTA